MWYGCGTADDGLCLSVSESIVISYLSNTSIVAL